MVHNTLQEKFKNNRINYYWITRILYCETINNFTSQYLGNKVEGISFRMKTYVIFWYRYLERGAIFPIVSSRVFNMYYQYKTQQELLYYGSLSKGKYQKVKICY